MNEYDIEVPFPRESFLSGYKGNLNTPDMTYTKEFVLPSGFRKSTDSVILHFGAVDQKCKVYLNDIYLGEHIGGYLPFEFDITDSLKKVNILKVECTDSLDRNIPYGKQTEKSSGMWYTKVSGIWQSVWIEAVPRHYIKDLKIKATKEKLILDVVSECSGYILTIKLEGKKEYKQFYEAKHIEISFNDVGIVPHFWSVDDPYLYTFTVKTNNDEVESYFGIKDFVKKDKRLYLNDEPFIIKGVLDQGYFSDGIFLPEDPQEYFNDVLRMKELGFNTLRKHIKLEPQVFYYACDKLGMLVMQDMVESGKWSLIYHAALPTAGINLNIDTFFVNRKRLELFKEHSKGIIKEVYNHPSVFSYTIYNEGWGQQCADMMYDILKNEDPDRLFDSTSGWFHKKKSDFISYHIYFRNKVLTKGNGAVLLSECGGYKRKIDGHITSDKEYGYASTDSEEALTAKYEEMFEKMIYPSIQNGMTGYIITQVSDVEEEINGFYTYDRQICKVNKKIILKLNEEAVLK